MRFFTILAAITCLAASAIAQFDVNASFQETANSYIYTYRVTNIGPVQPPEIHKGLCGYFLAVPTTTRIVGFTCPPPGMGYGHWDNLNPDNNWNVLDAAPPNYRWFGYWGTDWGSIYPPGTTAVFTLETEKNTIPGSTPGWEVTFWGEWASQNNNNFYSGTRIATLGPTLPVPEPATISALALGLLAIVRKRRSSIKLGVKQS